MHQLTHLSDRFDCRQTPHHPPRMSSPASRAPRITVVGCGVIGLTTAVLLQRYGAQVTIRSKTTPLNANADPEYTSDKVKTTPGSSERFTWNSRAAIVLTLLLLLLFRRDCRLVLTGSRSPRTPRRASKLWMS